MKVVGYPLFQRCVNMMHSNSGQGLLKVKINLVIKKLYAGNRQLAACPRLIP